MNQVKGETRVRQEGKGTNQSKPVNKKANPKKPEPISSSASPSEINRKKSMFLLGFSSFLTACFSPALPGLHTTMLRRPSDFFKTEAAYCAIARWRRDEKDTRINQPYGTVLGNKGNKETRLRPAKRIKTNARTKCTVNDIHVNSPCRNRLPKAHLC
jgi:hypothetical protein